jgi:hypothetical protein
MIKKKLGFSIALLACFLAAAGAANATQYSFVSSSYYWPGWGSPPTGYGNINNIAVIGDPDITSGIATVNSGKLTNLGFTVVNPTAPPAWDCNIQPGDLFIGTGSGTKTVWNYIVDLTTSSTWTVPGAQDGAVPAGSYNIYKMNIPIGNSSSNPGYTLSGTDNSGGWTGFYIRDNHPVAWGGSLTDDIGSVVFSGWGTSPSFDFTGLTGGGLTLSSGDITIGWEPNCANNVMYAQINVAEPSTLLLLGSGLAGLVGWRWRNSYFS